MATARRVAALLAAPALALGFSRAPVARRPAAPTPDRVVSRLHADARTAVEAGIMAQQRGRSDAVRRLGRVLERDRKLADERVLRLARGQGLRLSADERAGEDRAMLVRLEGVPDEQFDAEFLAAMGRRHERELAELRRARRSTPDRRLADLVGRLLPVVEQERQLAHLLRARPEPRARG